MGKNGFHLVYLQYLKNAQDFFRPNPCFKPRYVPLLVSRVFAGKLKLLLDDLLKKNMFSGLS